MLVPMKQFTSLQETNILSGETVYSGLAVVWKIPMRWLYINFCLFPIDLPFSYPPFDRRQIILRGNVCGCKKTAWDWYMKQLLACGFRLLLRMIHFLSRAKYIAFGNWYYLLNRPASGKYVNFIYSTIMCLREGVIMIKCCLHSYTRLICVFCWLISWW